MADKSLALLQERLAEIDKELEEYKFWDEALHHLHKEKENLIRLIGVTAVERTLNVKN